MLRRQAKKLLRKLELEGADLSVVLCDDEFIRNINKEWRHKDKATDVLSFPESSPEDIESFKTSSSEIPLVLGDIIISLDTAQKQAEAGLDNELNRLFVHGFAHLLGYDHNTDDEEAEMNEIETVLLNMITSRG